MLRSVRIEGKESISPSDIESVADLYCILPLTIKPMKFLVTMKLCKRKSFYELSVMHIFSSCVAQQTSNLPIA